MYEELKPCPHCNGTASLFKWVDYNPYESDGNYFVMVRCDVCGATGAQKETDRDDWKDWERLEQTTAAADCIAAWNLRSIPQDIENMIDERIAAALDNYSQTVPESALLAAGLIAEIEGEEMTAAAENDTEGVQNETI